MSILDETKKLLTARPGNPEDHPRNRHRYVLGKKGKWVRKCDVYLEYASEALAVAPDQIEDARAAFKEAGLGDVKFTPDGRPIVTGRRMFHKMCKAAGMFSGRDGYGAKDEDGRTVATGTRGEERKQWLRDQVRRMQEGRPADPKIEEFFRSLDFRNAEF